MKDLTTGSVTKHLLHMSAFLAASMLVQTLYLLADLYWVGHLGKEAIAAVGVAGNLTMIVLALTQMLGVGTTTLMSQAAGRKDQPHAEVVFNQSFVMSIVIAFGLGVVGFILRRAYCDWLSADVATADLAKAYLLWFLPGLLLQFPLVALGSALRATGIIKPAVGIQVLSVFLNIVLAPLLIFGIGPWPKLGVTKRDLIQYYLDVAPWLLPHLTDRAMVMKRYPNGAAGDFFFMKRAPSPKRGIRRASRFLNINAARIRRRTSCAVR